MILGFNIITILMVITVFVIQKGTARKSSGLYIASFNIRTFGKDTMCKPYAIATLKKIIRRYDLVFIQEIRDTANASIFKLRDIVNYRVWRGRKYRLLLSPRLGRTSSKETYAYLYRENKLKVLTSYVHDDGPEDSSRSDAFEREPFVVKFNSKATRFKTFFIIGCHIQPSRVPEELERLIHVYELAVQRLHTTNSLLMGDFNADCSYLNKGELRSHKMKTDARFRWLIDDEEDTTVARSSCAYDRIIAAGTKLKGSVVNGSAMVFNFTKKYGMTIKETESISDHYPVEVKLK